MHFIPYISTVDRLQTSGEVGLVDSVGVKGNDVAVAVGHGGSLDGDFIGLLTLLTRNYREGRIIQLVRSFLLFHTPLTQWSLCMGSATYQWGWP